MLQRYTFLFFLSFRPPFFNKYFFKFHFVASSYSLRLQEEQPLRDIFFSNDAEFWKFTDKKES
jgi:hypothetical protein